MLRKPADETDWETLPRHLQDAIDAMLTEESEAEGGEFKPWRQLYGQNND